MFRLTMILHLFIGATLSGVAIVAVLMAGISSMLTILGAALAGFLLAFPISHLIARKLTENG